MRRFLLLVLGVMGLPACLIDQATYDARLADLTRGETGASDADGDGFAGIDDCDDADAAVNPDAVEVCDGVDQDCDDAIDEDATDASTWYADRDGDGYGDGGDATLACDEPDGYVVDATDCDDSMASVHPGAAETAYDDIDQDCVGGDADDLDGDGYAGRESEGGDDCDDADATVHPDAGETWADGFTDNDCDGEVEAIQLEFGSAPYYLESPGAQFGRRVEPVGDLDGDGSAELLVGAVYDPRAGEMGGSVWLVTGSGGGEVSGGSCVVAGGSLWFLGTGLGSGPDANGDGVRDPIVGATGYLSGRGAAFGVSGAALLAGNLSLPEDAIWTVTGSEENTWSATISRTLGDTDGDGIDEVAISAPYAASGGMSGAGVVALFGADRLVGGPATLDDADIQWLGYYTAANFGQDVFAVGDQDRDGLIDIGITGSNGVPLALVRGGGAGGLLDADALTILTDEGAGNRAERVGDVDGDGRDDVALLDGDALLFVDLGATGTLVLADAYATFDGGEADVFSATAVGDIDGDGAGEVSMTIPGHVGYAATWLGVVNGAEWRYRAVLDESNVKLSAVSIRPNSGFGYRVANAGDLDGDGTDWLALGGWADDEGGEDAGAVALVPVPR